MQSGTTASKEASMALTPEQIDRLIQQADGRAPKEGSIFRALVKLTEAEARRDALEEAARVCESEWSNAAEKLYGIECAAAIRKLKEDS